jgi:hypothetical protein
MEQSQQVLEWQAIAASRAVLQTRREYLRTLLEERFGPLPEAVVQRINTTDDLERLHKAFRQAIHLPRLDDLQL